MIIGIHKTRSNFKYLCSYGVDWRTRLRYSLEFLIQDFACFRCLLSKKLASLSIFVRELLLFPLYFGRFYLFTPLVLLWVIGVDSLDSPPYSLLEDELHTFTMGGGISSKKRTLEASESVSLLGL